MIDRPFGNGLPYGPPASSACARFTVAPNPAQLPTLRSKDQRYIRRAPATVFRHNSLGLCLQKVLCVSSTSGKDTARTPNEAHVERACRIDKRRAQQNPGRVQYTEVP